MIVISLVNISQQKQLQNFLVIRTFKSTLNNFQRGNTVLLTIVTAKSLQSCPTLCDPIDGSPPGSPVPGILQVRTLERVAISFSSAWKWKVKVKSLSHVWLFVTPWTAAHQAPLSMGFSRPRVLEWVPVPSHLFWFMYKLIPKHLYFITGNLHLLTTLTRFWPHTCFWQNHHRSPVFVSWLCVCFVCLFV